ncbi:MAG: tRNA (guanosine(37)-N1)-methyltransferase TrmD [Bacteroidales bacterium]|nr:tRNA (guanosine(37)-N1)-methyltransferase TrmD [Bacteroidales bacterium]
MRIDILTLFPEMFDGPFNHSIIKRAKEKGLVEIHLHDIRLYSTNKHKRVDDYPYGGGAGMVMVCQPVADCIEKLKSEREYDDIIYMSPDGEVLEQKIANRMSSQNNLMLLCGHYKGVDERIREHYVTREISIGDYVLTGGELAAAVVTDTVVRLLPGVLNDETSMLTDSFQDNLVSPPVYTRPYDYKGWTVPDILLSGNDKLVAEWRHEEAVKRTRERRPNFLKEEE